MTHNVTLIYGDGIGPEVVTATRKIIDATGVKVNWEVCEAGAEVFKRGLASGVPNETIDSIKRNRVVLKGPLETPVGFGEKSANVTLRKLFETFGNIRPVKEFLGVTTPFSGRNIDFVIVRENVEDLYTGIEYMQTPTTAECLKLISRRGCEKIIRLAFELARAEGRKSVHCATKANIMKLTEGLMKKVFEEISPEYSDIESQHIIIDNCAHQLVRSPEKFETIVTTNMNGDILSDLGSGLVGGLGFAPGANIGSDIAIFEAVHGSAPKYAGKNVINPVALLLSGVMMLRHLNEFEVATTIEQAVYYTLGVQKVFTQDVAGKGKGVSTTAFTDQIIENFGQRIPGSAPRDYKPIKIPVVERSKSAVKSRSVAGVDIFIETDQSPAELGPQLESLAQDSPFYLKMLSSRGVIVYPVPGVVPEAGDYCRARFILKETSDASDDGKIVDLISCINKKYRWTHIEKLNVFDGENGFSKAQGEE